MRRTDSNAKRKILQNLSINDLEHLSAKIPAGTIPKGVSLVVKISATGTAVGWAHDSAVPTLGAISEIQRMFSAGSIIGAVDALSDRSLSGLAVRTAMMKTVKNKIEQIKTGPGSQANIALALGFLDNLKENEESLKRNVSNLVRADDARDVLKNAVSRSKKVLFEYIHHETTSGGIKKTLKETCLEHHAPFALFSKLTTKGWIPDSPQQNLMGLLFPKNLGNRITLRVEEWADEELTSVFGAELINKSWFERALIKNAFDVMAIERPTQLQFSKLKELVIPLCPPYTLEENLLAGRSAPMVSTETDFGLLRSILAIRTQSLCGMRMRKFNQNLWWTKVTGFNVIIDPSGVSPREQILGFIKGKELDIDQDEIAVDLHPFITGLWEKEAFLGNLIAEDYDVAYVDDTSNHAFVLELKDGKIIDLTEEEKNLLKDPKMGLPKVDVKKRNFPQGGTATAYAMRVITAIRKSRFSGSTIAASSFLTSFSEDVLTNHAAKQLESILFRKGEENVLFDTAEASRDLNIQAEIRFDEPEFDGEELEELLG